MSVTTSYRILRAEHTSWEGDEWRVDIHDSSAAMTNTRTATLSSAGVNIRMEGKNELWDWIHPTTAEFTLMINSQDLEDTVLAFADSAPQRYYVFIYKNDTRVFVGMIVTDTVRIEDTPWPYGYTIRAIDGLSVLKEQEYSNGGVAFTGKESFAQLLTRCLNFMPTSGFYDDSAPPTTEYMLYTAVNWYEDSMNGTTKDPLEWTRFNNLILDKREEYTDEPEFYTCWELLELACIRWCARLFYQDGHYWFVQPQEILSGSTFTVWKYLRNGSASTTSGTEGSQIDIRDATNTTADGRSLAGGIFSYYRSLKEVCVKTPKLLYNYAQDVEWNNASQTSVTVSDLDTTTGTLRFKISGKLWIKVSQSTLTPGDFFEVSNNIEPCRVKISIQFTIGGSTYCRRDIAGQNGYYFYNDPEWQGTSDTVEFYSEPFLFSGEENIVDINFTSPEMPDVGTADLVMAYTSITALEQYGWPSASLPDTIEWEFKPILLRVIDRDNIIKAKSYEQTCAVNDNNNTRKVEYEVIWNDPDPNVNDPYGLEVLTVSGYARSASWTYQGNQYSINELTAKTIASMQKLPLKVRSGGFTKADIKAYSLLNYQGSNYMPVTWTNNTERNEHYGEFIVLSEDLTNITLDTITSELAVRDGDLTQEGTLSSPDLGYYNGLPGLVIGERLSAGAVTSITIEAAAYDSFKDGDIIRILDPYTGNSDTLEVTTNVSATDTSVAVSGTLSLDYNVGSMLFLDVNYSAAKVPRENSIEYGIWDGVTAAFIDLTTPTTGDAITPPDSDTLTVTEINKRLSVWRNGRKLRYRGDYSGAFTDYGWKLDDDNSRIYFFPDLEDEDIEVENRLI